MQNEFTVNAIAWGFSTFSKNKCRVKAFSSLSNDPTCNDFVKHEAAAPFDQLMNECSQSEPLIISQGSTFEIGLEFSPLSSFVGGTTEDFIASFEKHKQFLKLDVQLKLDGRNVLRRETADSQKFRGGWGKDYTQLDCAIFRRKTGVFYIGTTTSIQLPQECVNLPIQLTLAVSVAIPESSQPTNHRAHMSSEELALRAMLEGGRYRVPKIEPIALSLPVVVIDSLQVECWSKRTGPWSALLGVELSNMHPHRALQIQNVEVNLPATLSIYDNPLHDHAAGDGSEDNPDRLYSPCFPPVQHWLDAVPLPAAPPASAATPALVASGETLTVVFKVSHNHAGREITTICESGNRSHCWNFAQSLCSAAPPASLSGDFVSPVDIRWREVPPDTRLNTPQCAAGVEEMRGGDGFMQSTVPVYWEVERREGNEFVVDISGPDEGERFQPLALQVLVTNHTADTRDLVIYLQDPTLISTSELRDSSELGKFLNHDISVLPAAGLAPGESAALRALVHPLQAGQLNFASIYIVDAGSGEMFTSSSAYSVFIR